MKVSTPGCSPIHRMAETAHELLAARLASGDQVMDGTMGNGHDTLFLWQQVQPAGCVTAFDVQGKAIEATRKRLLSAGWTGDASSVRLIRDSHSRLDQHIHQPLKAAMFNLGYLPGADKQIVTRWHDLKQALDSLCGSMIIPGGIVSIIAYSGHPEGRQEQQQLLAFGAALRPDEWAVTVMRRINASTAAPVLVMMQKKE